MDLEALLTHPQGFQLTTAMPLMRAICRAETGLPLGDLAKRPEVVECFGGHQAIGMLPNRPPKETVLLAAVRTGKSKKAAAKAFRASQLCDIRMLKSGEMARYSVLSIDKDKADAVLEQLIGAIEASPVLRQVFKRAVGDTVELYHPSGREVEIKVMAGKRAGGAVVARWSLGATFDEAPRMQGGDKVINLPETLKGLRARLLPGAQVDMVGSPDAPRGPIYDLYVERFGRPGPDMLFMLAKGPDLHPQYFTPELIETLDDRTRRTDVEAKFADGEDSLLSSLDVEACTRPGPEFLEPNEQPCVAAIDPANRRNAWTLIILRPRANGKPEVVYARQWMGSRSAPLKSSRIFAAIFPILALYRVGHDPQTPHQDGDTYSLITDQASFDDKHELAEQQGIRLVCDDFKESEWREHAKRLERFVSEHSISLPPNAALRADILGMQKRLTSRSWSVELVKTNDGRHGDFAPALCLALKHLPEPALQLLQPNYDPLEQRVLESLRHQQSDPMHYAAEQLQGMFR